MGPLSRPPVVLIELVDNSSGVWVKEHHAVVRILVSLCTQQSGSKMVASEWQTRTMRFAGSNPAGIATTCCDVSKINEMPGC
jgi:hypothetical protein